MKLIDYVKPTGAQAALARLLDVPPVLISQWARGKRLIPLERCVEIEQATKKIVTCEEMRPDKAALWAYLRSSCSSCHCAFNNSRPATENSTPQQTGGNSDFT